MSSRFLLALLALLASLGFASRPASAQEVDRATRGVDRERLPAGKPAPDPAPVVSSTLRAPSVVEDDLDPSLFPERIEQQAEPQEPESLLEVEHGGKLWTVGGYDTNVFRSERGTKGDGFGQAHGEAELLLKLPNGGELFLEVAGESLVYSKQNRANEHYVSTFFEYFQVATDWLELGVQNAFEFSRLNLLDDVGDLLPRGRFGSIDEEPRAFVILRPGDPEGLDEGVFHMRDLSFELGTSYRYKDYEENRGVDSLDYQELRFDLSIRYRVARSPRSRLKLKYRFRRRDYRQFRARERDGLIGTFAPTLDLERHQLNLRWTQQIQLEQFWGRVVVDLGLTYNRDTYRNDRSYREASFSLGLEWWPVKDATRVDVAARGIGRDFLVRRPSQDGGRLRHRLLRFQLGVWQRLWNLEQGWSLEAGTRPGETLMLAVFGTATATLWRSRDFREDYDRLVVSAGLELSW
ncbi:MAG TPA: hypothetical protein DEA08_09110 [Planctomycetes bacterium]|nr:hypothetical protein [Planctomycetota bacterium]